METATKSVRLCRPSNCFQTIVSTDLNFFNIAKSKSYIPQKLDPSPLHPRGSTGQRSWHTREGTIIQEPVEVSILHETGIRDGHSTCQVKTPKGKISLQSRTAGYITSILGPFHPPLPRSLNRSLCF